MKATVTLVFSEFSNKKYHYPVQIDAPANISDIAIQVSKQILEAQAKAKKSLRRSGKHEVYPAYNLMMKILPDALDKIGLEFNLPDKMKTKEQAFRMMHEANMNPPVEKIECRNCGSSGKLNRGDEDIECPVCNGHGYLCDVMWQRVGRSPDNVLCMDIDNPDIDNAKFVVACLETMFGYPFYLNGSYHDGKLCSFQIVGSKTYEDKEEWLWHNCRALNNKLERKDLKEYLKKLDAFDQSLKGSNKDFSEEFRKSGLYYSWGDFDVMYTVISIRRRKSTIRISKKKEGDRYGLIEVKKKKDSRL